MKPKNTCILVLLAGALFAFIYFVDPRLHHPVPPPARVIPDLQPAEVKEIVLSLRDQPEIRVEHTNGGWIITKPLVYPAQSEAIDALIKTAAGLELTPQTYISAADLKGHLTMNTEYGFDNPQAAITFGDHPKLILGSFTAPGDQIYAQLVGLEGVDILDADFFKKLFPGSVNDWRDTLFFHFAPADFDRLTVVAGPQTFTLQRDGPIGVWRMTMPVQSRANYPKIEVLLAVLQKLLVAQFVTDNDHADLEAYGLQPPAFELDFDRGTNRQFALQFGKSPTNDPAHLYARCVGRNAIVLVPREPLDPWLGGYQEFRDRRLLRLTGLPDVVEVSGQENFALERESNEIWRMTSPEKFTADTNVMLEFLHNLAVLEVAPVNGAVAVNDAVLPDVELPGYGLAPPVRRYLLRQNPSNLPAGVTNPVIAELDFGLQKDGRVFVRRADHPEETSVYAVRAMDFEKLPGSPIHFRPRRIWDFSQEDVVTIDIRQDGKVLEVFHKAPNQWGIGKGSGIINELQVEIAAQELGLLEAADWVKRGDADRANYGFTDHSLQISAKVNVNRQPQIFTLDIAENSRRGISPNGLRYGIVKMPDGENWIFEIPTAVLDRLSTYLNIHETPVP